MAKIFVGTSGWNYQHWRKVFYPEGLAQKKWLEHYAKSFNCLELNVTFYRLVPKKTFGSWYQRTPAEFRFIAKGSRFITHIKRLRDIKQPLKLFLNNVLGLSEKLAAVLWQFPFSQRADYKRLEDFLFLLDKTGIRQIFEFRHETWFYQDVYYLLKKHKACLCIADSDRYPCIKKITSDFIYLRFHGRGSLYGGNYQKAQLVEWARFAEKYKGKDIFAFFNNDAYGHAVNNALSFKDLLSGASAF